MQSAPAACQVLYDNFDDNTTSGAAWSPSVFGTGPTIIETHQRVEITIPADSTAVPPDSSCPLCPPSFGAWYDFRCLLRGDFDVQLDYSLLIWPPASGAAIGFNAGPAVQEAERGVVINRTSRPFGEQYMCAVGLPGAPPYVFVPTSDLSGTLRITRVGDVGAGYYLGSAGGWVSVTSGQVSTSDMGVGIIGIVQPVAAQPGLEQQLVEVAVDNFIVHQGELVGCNVCADATAPGPMTRSKLTIRKLNTPPGDDKLTFTGQLSLSSPFSPALDPLTNGVRLLLEGTAGSLLDAVVPGGAHDGSTRKGWKVNRSGTKWTYQDKTATPADGIAKVVIQDRSAATPGLVKFTVNGKAGSYAVAPDDLPVTARLILAPPGAKCGDTSFSSCAFNSAGSTLKCK